MNLICYHPLCVTKISSTSVWLPFFFVYMSCFISNRSKAVMQYFFHRQLPSEFQWSKAHGNFWIVGLYSKWTTTQTSSWYIFNKFQGLCWQLLEKKSCWETRLENTHGKSSCIKHSMYASMNDIILTEWCCYLWCMSLWPELKIYIHEASSA